MREEKQNLSVRKERKRIAAESLKYE